MGDVILSLAELAQQKRGAIYYPLDNIRFGEASVNKASLDKASQELDSDLLLLSLLPKAATGTTALEWNWQQVFALIDCLADELAAQGVSCQQGLALIGKNSLSQLLLYLAGLSLGARLMVINPQFPAEKTARILSQNQLDFYCSAMPLPVFEAQADKAQSRYLSNQGLASAVSEIISAEYDKNYQRVTPRLWQQALTMTLTSGSGGEPKAVVHDLAAHWQNALGVNEFLAFDSSKSWLLSLPLYHVSGQGIVWRWLSAAAELHFSGIDFYRSIGRATHVSLVPTQLQRYLAYLEQASKIQKSAVEHQLAATEAVLLGGAPIDPTLCTQAQAAGLSTFSGYGMTEMASTVFVCQNDRKQPQVRLLRGRELCIREQEIWLRGAGLAQGYWRDGKIVPLLNPEGWYQTKDRGQWHNGNLTVLGRLDNQFISGGENIQPEEIERVLQQYSEIEQAVVLPWVDAEFGYRPVAMVKFKQPFSAQLVGKVRLWLQDKLERFKQPIAYYPLPLEAGLQQMKVARRSLLQALQQLQHQAKDNQ
ncbi:o-succinylbenzoate--CoA ligase [Testudinibacter sp. TR-2022]|uniref:o-succinylbenzoate--CoA ligase n=1 Tax=Testudinibacter sp. TR-2022 TaxID=2585029 RepID=UPI00111B679C|nr:o-succinylbenzoate--CoA ligase [Testudinibacter sp. TR-2022]TNH05822.1 o-succinylbenzoate--CoA ligase [Pasteurellaceae bacterium Phil31]TNH07343.1 o-succinylbenzoate--CoA ligase [Testudinibacter sp. TR-2022]TNH10696.1 o-succinylbenzoate--CoA ligase [Testudinibacter sp. TR-2022]TNH14304.1 o-succinylbenzoate--CoA ligase [Testudinibacter sp. TR-2022]TNH16378.1 o-succinylbenzoate--CoA ligase [Testudinibacter sp. TR-2022]